MATATSTSASGLALGTAIGDDGIAAINFFNGRLLTGKDLSREQTARRLADQRVGQAHGPGMAWGLEVAALGSTSPGQVRVSAGLGVAPNGQVLKLAADTVVNLAGSGANNLALTPGDFGACPDLGAGTYVAGDGLFLLTLAPALKAEGKAPVLALEAVNLRCATDVWIESVQLRLLTLSGWTVNGDDAVSHARLRNLVANEILASAANAGAHGRPGTSGPADRLFAMAGENLTDCDLPLAVIYRIGTDIQFVDAWSVRRRLAAAPASTPWSAWIGEKVQARAEARLMQFQAQLAESGSFLLEGPASAALDWLPPAGFLPPGTNWAGFLGARANTPPIPLAPSDAADLLAGAMQGDSIKLSNAADPARFRVYRLDGDGWMLFVRDARNVHAAEQVWLDGARSDLPGSRNVQSAIDTLRAGSCLHVALWPDLSHAEMQQKLDSVAGQDASVSFEPGKYDLASTLRVHKSQRVWIRGPGARLINKSGGPALIVQDCSAADVRHIALQSLATNINGDTAALAALGTLTILNTPTVHIEGVDAACDSGRGKPGACIVVDCSKLATGSSVASRVVIQSCQARAGRDTRGLVSVNAASARIRDNLIEASEAASCAIEVTGTVAAKDVTVVGNTARRVVNGIKVAGTSTVGTVITEQVLIDGNHIELLPLGGSGEADRFGIMLDGADAARLSGNHIKVAAGTADFSWQGLRLAGRFGPQLSVRDNLTVGLLRGIVFRPDTQPSLGAWVFDGNVALRDRAVVIDLPTDLRDTADTESGLVQMGCNRPMRIDSSSPPEIPKHQEVASNELDLENAPDLKNWGPLVKIGRFQSLPGVQVNFIWRGGDANLSFGPFDLDFPAAIAGKILPSIDFRFTLTGNRDSSSELIHVEAGKNLTVESFIDNLPGGAYSLVVEARLNPPATEKVMPRLRGISKLIVTT